MIAAIDCAESSTAAKVVALSYAHCNVIIISDLRRCECGWVSNLRQNQCAGVKMIIPPIKIRIQRYQQIDLSRSLQESVQTINQLDQLPTETEYQMLQEQKKKEQFYEV